MTFVGIFVSKVDQCAASSRKHGFLGLSYEIFYHSSRVWTDRGALNLL